MAYVQKAVRGASVVFLMTLLAGVISYGTRIILARHLGPEDYGLFTSVFTFVALFLFFRDLGLGQALVKYIATYKIAEKYHELKTAIVSVLAIQLASSGFVSILFIALSNFLAVYYFKDPRAKLILMILMGYVFTSVLFTLAKQILNGLQENVLYSVMEPLKNLIILLLTILFFSWGFGISAAALPYLLVCPLIFLLFAPIILQKFSFFQYKIVSFKENSKALVQFGLPVLATDVGGRIIGYIDTLMLTYMRTLTEVGVYNVVLPTAVFFILVSRAISSVIFPMTSELVFRKDYSRLRTGIGLLHRYTFIIAIPLVFTLFAFSSLFIELFFGKEYLAGALAFQILLVGVILFMVAGINNTIIAGMGEPQAVTKIIFAAAILNVVVNLVIIPTFGITGAAFATSLSYTLVLILSTRHLTRKIGMKFPWKQWAALILPATMYVVAILTVQSLWRWNVWAGAVLAILAGLLLYGLTLYLFELIDLTEVKYYIKIALKR